MTRILSPLVREFPFFVFRDGQTQRLDLVLTLDKTGEVTLREKGRRTGEVKVSLGMLYLHPELFPESLAKAIPAANP